MRLSPGVAVLWRGGRSAQVGLVDPVIVEGDDAAAAAALEDGRLSVERQRAHGVLLARIDAARKLDRRPAPAADPGPPGPRVRIRGLDGLGTAAGLALARAGVGTLCLADRRPRWRGPAGASAGVVAAGAQESRAAQAARAVAELGLDVRVELADARPVDLEVVVAMGTVPVPRQHALTVAGTPHVAVLTDEAGASIVPVRPGRSPCLRCRDLARADADPSWPLLARQCEARAAWADAATSATAGAIAAASALALLAPAAPPPPVRVERGLAAPEPRAWHPRCGCADHDARAEAPPAGA